MRKLIIGVTSVAVVAVGGIWAAAVYFLDSTTIAQQLKVETAKRLNRELVFNGQLQTKFFPKVQIVLPPTTLSYEGKTEPQFTLTGASIGVALLPLIKGDIQFDAVSIEGLKGVVNAKRFTQKVDQKKSQHEEPKEAAPEDGSSFVKNLKVASVSIRDCALTVYGLQDQKVYAVSQLNLETGEIGLEGTTPVKFSTNFAEKTQGLTGSMTLQTTAKYNLNMLDVTLSDMKTNVRFNQDKTENEIGLQATKVAYLKRDVAIDKLSLLANMGNAMNVVVSADQFKTENMNTWQMAKVNAQVKQGDALAANITGNFTGSVKAMSVASNDIAGTVDTAINGIKTQIPLAGKLSASVSEEKASVALHGKFDGKTWTANANVKGFKKPNITGNVDLVSLTVDKWLPKETTKTASVSFAPISEALADSVERLTALDMANANIGIKVGEVRYKQLPVTGIATTVRLQDSVLRLNNMKASLCDGAINANMVLDAGQNWSLTQSANRINVQRLLKGLELPDQLTGTVQMNTKLSGTGLDETAIKKTANGTLDVKVNNAVLKGISLEKVAKAVRDKKVSGLIMTPEDQTQFSAMNATVVVNNGRLSVKNLTGQSAIAAVNGAVDIGLLDNSMIGKVSAVLATSIDGRRVTVPIAIGGTVAAPAYGIDLASAIKDNLTAEVKEKGRAKLEEGIGKLLNRLNR